jgi:hypothetical protein
MKLVIRVGLLDAQDVKPHKVRYYLERRDLEFATKWWKWHSHLVGRYRFADRPDPSGAFAI